MITPEAVAEWDAAETGAQHARKEDKAAQTELATATAHAAQTAEALRAAEAREAAAEAVLIPFMEDGKMRAIHPAPIEAMVRQGNKIVRGTIRPIVEAPA